MALTKVTSGVRTIATDEIVTASIADDAVTTSKIADDAVGVAQLSATGSPSATTFLRGDNAWAAPAGLVTAGTPLVQDPFTINTTTTTAHGLGAVPSFLSQQFECKTAEHGYSIGDIVELNVVGPGEGSYSGHGAVVKDATNLSLITTNATYGIPNKTTRVIYGITPANWKLTITPYKVT
jgi:hypothetical protein